MCKRESRPSFEKFWFQILNKFLVHMYVKELWKMLGCDQIWYYRTVWRKYCWFIKLKILPWLETFLGVYDTEKIVLKFCWRYLPFVKKVSTESGFNKREHTVVNKTFFKVPRKRTKREFRAFLVVMMKVASLAFAWFFLWANFQWRPAIRSKPCWELRNWYSPVLNCICSFFQIQIGNIFGSDSLHSWS